MLCRGRSTHGAAVRWHWAHWWTVQSCLRRSGAAAVRCRRSQAGCSPRALQAIPLAVPCAHVVAHCMTYGDEGSTYQLRLICVENVSHLDAPESWHKIGFAEAQDIQHSRHSPTSTVSILSLNNDHVGSPEASLCYGRLHCHCAIRVHRRRKSNHGTWFRTYHLRWVCRS